MTKNILLYERVENDYVRVSHHASGAQRKLQLQVEHAKITLHVELIEMTSKISP